jgi:gamma-glutamyltranspeptidase/glutathione hydrolase
MKQKRSTFSFRNEERNGIISLEDLKNYKTKERKALQFDYKNHEIVSMPLPSSGGILLAQMLKMSSFENLENFQQNSPEAVQVMVKQNAELCRPCRFMGDPDFIEDKPKCLFLKNI